MSGERTNHVAVGTLPNFRGGWAIIPFVEKPHYWKEWDPCIKVHRGNKRVRIYRSACGVFASTVGPQKAIVPGNFPKCKKCARSIPGSAE